MAKRIPLKELIRRAENVHGVGRYDYSLITEENYKNTHTNVNIKCNECGDIFPQTLSKHINQKQGCPNCAKNKKGTTESFIAKARKIHGDKYDYSKVEYVNANTDVLIKCNNCGDIFPQLPSSHLRGHGCPNCAGVKPMNTESFIEKAKKVHGDKYDYSKVNYVNAYTDVLIKCNDCGTIFPQTPNCHLNGSGCPECAKKRGCNTESFIEKARKIHGNFYDYSKVEYIDSKTDVIIGCPNHGDFSQPPNRHLEGHGCPFCNTSKGEREISLLLKSKNINYIPQYEFKDCKDIRALPFDFYLPDYNICIEYDGEQHFTEIAYFGGKQKLDYIQSHDSIKTNYCKQNNISLLRIRFDEDIEEKLNQFLLDKCKIEPQSIFDL